MKKRVLTIALCLVMLSLCACGKPASQTTDTAETDASQSTTFAALTTVPQQTEPETATEPETEPQTEPETFVAATVSVRFLENNLPPAGQYETCTAVESPQTRIVLSTNATVRDFKVLALTDGDMDDDGNMHFTTEEIKTFDRLTADRPLVVATTFYGLIPNNGISYVDETGKTRTFAVDMSGEDGSLYLWEF